MEQAHDKGAVVCLVEMHFATGERDRATSLLVTVVERIRAKAGCGGCWVSRDAVESGIVRYSEIWETEPMFHAHVQSNEFRHVLTALDMCSREPTVTIGRLTGIGGFEHLKDLRRGSQPLAPAPSQFPED
jgi:quinol monooxygenase YgiN